jgi:ribonuclease P protein component
MRGAAAFARMFRQGRRIEGEYLQLLVVASNSSTGRVGYVIGKQQLPRAVDRNRLRRAMREAVRRRRPAINAFDVVLRLRRPCLSAAVRSLGVEAATLLDKITRPALQ